MGQDKEHATQNSVVLVPTVGSCYRNGWRQLWKNVLELFLILIISFVISLPFAVGRTDGGAGTVALGILLFAYSVLIVGPITYGMAFAYLKAARGDRLKVKDMFEVFRNYLNAVLASLLVDVIILVGIFPLHCRADLLRCGHHRGTYVDNSRLGFTLSRS